MGEQRGVRKGDIFRWWVSDRSGLQFGFVPITSPPNAYTRESGRPVKDHGIQVAPDEYDQPPPSNKPLGGEGEIGTGARADSSPATPSNVYGVSNPIPVYYLTASSKIPWTTENIPTLISGSNQAVTLGNNPLDPGTPQLYISIQGVGSGVTINSGNGITFDFARKPSITINSGSIATLIYNATDSTWHVTSFTLQGAI